MTGPDDVRKVVDAYVDSYRRNDKQACIDLFAADAVWHDPVGEPPHVGHEGVGAFWDQARALAKSIELVPSDVIVCRGPKPRWCSRSRSRSHPEGEPADDHGCGRGRSCSTTTGRSPSSRVLGHVPRRSRAQRDMTDFRSSGDPLAARHHGLDFRSDPTSATLL